MTTDENILNRSSRECVQAALENLARMLVRLLQLRANGTPAEAAIAAALKSSIDEMRTALRRQYRRNSEAWISAEKYMELLGLIVGRAAGHVGLPPDDEPRRQRDWWVRNYGKEKQRKWRLAAEQCLNNPRRRGTILSSPEALYELDRFAERRQTVEPAARQAEAPAANTTASGGVIAAIEPDTVAPEQPAVIISAPSPSLNGDPAPGLATNPADDTSVAKQKTPRLTALQKAIAAAAAWVMANEQLDDLTVYRLKGLIGDQLQKEPFERIDRINRDSKTVIELLKAMLDYNQRLNKRS
jgi:hypothetical protein